MNYFVVPESEHFSAFSFWKGEVGYVAEMVHAVQHVRRMRGGAQAHLMRCTDGHYYVVKFQNNPQHVRVLANELLASRLAEQIGLPVPACDVVEVSPWLVESTEELRIEQGSHKDLCTPGLCFGSRYVADPGHLLPLHDAVEKVKSGAIKPRNRRPSRIPLRSLFSFVGSELARRQGRRSSRCEVTSDTRNCGYCEKFRVTKVTFTPAEAASTIQHVVWQFWGRAAEASLTEKSRALFYCVLAT